MLDHVETQVSAWAEWLRLLVEEFSALVIGAGVLPHQPPSGEPAQRA